MSKGRISPEFLQKIKDAVNIVDVVGEHVVLRKSGSNFTGLCPFHNERSPSFSVSEQKQLYHCYGCKKGGDLVGFVREIHGLSFVEAVEELADRANLQLPKDFQRSEDEDPEAAKRRGEQREKLATAYRLNRFAAKFFREQLSNLGSAHIAEYIRKRGVDSALSQTFYLGAAPASWDALASFFVNAKAPLPLAVELGLLKPSQKGGGRPGGPGYFDLFRNRAIFPILDLRGKVVGFGGRGLPNPPGAPDVGGESPKYLNSSESLLFQKSKVAYGLFQAQKHIREKDEVILVEGYFDVLALHAAGFRNAVATCGTSLTEDHLQLFKKFASKVTVLFDGDRAGVTATDRAMELGLKNGAVLYGATLPEGLDPDEILFDRETGGLLPEGVERMSAILAASQPLLDARLESARVFALKGPEQRTQAIKQVAEWLALFRDPIGQEVRIDRVSRDFEVSRELLQRAMMGGKSQVPQQRSRVSTSVIQPKKGSSGRPFRHQSRQKLSQKEVILLRGVLRGGRFRTMFEEARSYVPAGIEVHQLADHPWVQRAIAALLEEKAPESILESLQLAETDSEGAGEILGRIRVVFSESLMGGDSPGAAPFTEGEFRIAVQRGLSDAWARFSQELKLRLKDAELRKDKDLHAVLMQEYLDVQRRMKELSTFYEEV